MKRLISLIAFVSLTTICFAQKKDSTTSISTAPPIKELRQDTTVDDNTALLSANDINSVSSQLGNYLSDKLKKSDWDLVMNTLSQLNQQVIDKAVTIRKQKKGK